MLSFALNVSLCVFFVSENVLIFRDVCVLSFRPGFVIVFVCVDCVTVFFVSKTELICLGVCVLSFAL